MDQKQEIIFGQNQGMWLKRNFLRPHILPMAVSFKLKRVVGSGPFYSHRQIYNALQRYIHSKNLVTADDISSDRKLRALLGRRVDYTHQSLMKSVHQNSSDK
jgi:hypothetical protein